MNKRRERKKQNYLRYTFAKERKKMNKLLLLQKNPLQGCGEEIYEDHYCYNYLHILIYIYIYIYIYQSREASERNENTLIIIGFLHSFLNFFSR